MSAQYGDRSLIIKFVGLLIILITASAIAVLSQIQREPGEPALATLEACSLPHW